MIKPYMRRWLERFSPAMLPLLGGDSERPPVPRSERLQFLEAYEEVVAAILESIHGHPREDVSWRYMILALADAPDSYVQCAFDEGDLSVLCEAASGFFAEPDCGPSFSGEQRQALTGLGFSMDIPESNFAQHLTFDDEPDIDSIARLLLKSLYLGYGANKDRKIIAEAPLAWPRGVLSTVDEMIDEIIRSRE